MVPPPTKTNMDQFNAQLEQTLRAAIQGDSESIKAATNKLHTEFYTKPEAVVGLIQILQKHPEQPLRQLAGVEAKKIILRFWVAAEGSTDPMLPEEQKNEIKKSLLHSTIEEPSDLVRHTSARVIANIAAVDFDSDNYPELFPAIIEFSRSSAAHSREIGAFVIYAILENDICETFMNHGKDVMELLANGLKDPESLQVRVSSVLALGMLYLGLDEECASKFETLIPTFMEILDQCIKDSDEKAANDIFETFNELSLYSDSPSEYEGQSNSRRSRHPFNKYYGDMITHMLNHYAADPNLEDDLRNAALNFVLNIVRFKPKQLQTLKLGTEVVKSCIQILAQPSDDDDDEDDDDDTDTPAQISLRVLSHLSEALPPKQVIAPIIDTMPSLINSGNPDQAYAGFMSFAATLEGAPEYADSHIDIVLSLIVKCLTADNSKVKIAAFRTLAVTSTELPLSVAAEHATLLPLVFQILDSANTIRIAGSACLALVRILEILDRKTITENYLDAVVGKLMSLVGHIDDLELKGIVVECIGGAALSAGKNFLPYFEQTIQVIQNFIGVPQGDNITSGQIKLAGMALETLSTLCSAVGADAYRGFLPASMQAAFNYLASGKTELRENALIMISVSAKVFKDEFVPYLDRTMEVVFEVCDQLEFPIDQFDPETVGLNGDDDDEGGIKVNSDVAVEKEYACDLVREILSNTSPANFNKYLEKTFDVMEELSNHFYYEIRREVAITLWKLFGAYISLEVPRGQWTHGFPFKGQLSDVNKTIAEKVLQLTTDMITVEDEAPVLSTMFDCITNATREFGPVALGSESDLECIMSTVVLVLQKQHACNMDDEGEDLEAGEASEGAMALIDYAIDTLSQIVACFEADFKPLFPTVASTLQPYVQSKNPLERQSGVTAFAEILRNMRGNLNEHDATLMDIFAAGLSDKKLGVRSVSAWGAGLMYEFSTSEELLKASYPTILGKLQSLLKKVDKAEKKRVEADEEELHNDNLSLANACGCVARISMRYSDLVPLDQVLPVLFSHLPIISGFEENAPVFKFIWTLVEHQHPFISQNIDELVRILNSVIQTHIETEASNQLKGVYEVDSPSPLDDPEAKTAVQAIVTSLAKTNMDVVQKNPALQVVLN